MQSDGITQSSFDVKEFGVRVRQARKRRNELQSTVADRASISRSYISRIELGDTSVKITIGVAFKIAQALEEPIEDLLGLQCYSVTDEESLTLMEKVKELTPERRRDLRDIAEAFLKQDMKADFDELNHTIRIDSLYGDGLLAGRLIQFLDNNGC